MSDTKTLIKYVRDRLNDEPNITFGKPTARDLVEAIEQAEAEAAQLQQRVNDLLSEELTDGAVRERIQLRFNMHEVLQQNERLSKMVDWLAGRCSEELGFSDSLFKERKATVNEWKEAARRAVAAWEEPCQK